MVRGGAPPRSANQVARKSARGKPLNSSLGVISTALAESPLPKINAPKPNVLEPANPTVPGTVPRSRETEQPPPLSSYPAPIRTPPRPTPISGVRKGEISDDCFQNIVELFAKRYIMTFDRDHLALEGAYMSESTFSCRYLPISHPSPHHLSKCNISNLQGHSRIIQTISSFSRHIVFDPLDVTIDVLRLPDMNYFVTMIFDTVVDGVGVSVDMVFLLKESSGLAGKRELLRVLWTPFVVVCHQIILRS